MNNEYLSIAETDFNELKTTDRTEAADRLVMTICDPELTAKRIAMLIGKQIEVGKFEIADDHFEHFQPAIDAIGLHGVLPALNGNHLTLDQLIAVVNDPDALRRAHIAVVSDMVDDFDETEFEQDGEADPMQKLDFNVAYRPAAEFLTLASARGWNPRIMKFSEALGAATNDTPPDASSEKLYSQYRDRIVIDATLTEIPHGLCRLVLVDMSDSLGLAMITMLPPLNWFQEHWFWDQSMDDLFGRPMNDVEVRPMLIVADKTNRADFDSDQVRDFVRDLDDGPQKQLASQYLFGSMNNNV